MSLKITLVNITIIVIKYYKIKSVTYIIKHVYNLCGIYLYMEFADMSNNEIIEPSYYNKASMSVCDIIDEYGLDFYKGNIIKYVLRSGKKSADTEIQDLEKAIKYCILEIERLKKNESK